MPAICSTRNCGPCYRRHAAELPSLPLKAWRTFDKVCRGREVRLEHPPDDPMKFQCDRCKTRYSIADEKVRGKILKIRCKTCSTIINVRDPAIATGVEP